MSLKIRKISEEPGIDETGDGFKGVNTVWAVLKREDLKGFSSRIFRIESGGHTAFHSHEREHLIVVLTGSCKIGDGENEYTARTGSIIKVPQNLTHRFSNPFREKLVLLIMNFYTANKVEKIE